MSNEQFKIDFQCNECKKEVGIYKNNILPGMQLGYDNDQFLIWHIRCPECKKIYTLDAKKEKEIPKDLKLELLDKYSGIANATMGIWICEKKIFDAMQELQKEKKYIDGAQPILNEEKEKCLYKYWKSNKSIIEDQN